MVAFSAYQSVVGQTFTLPELTYQYSDLEPYIDSVTMQIHHSRHHKAYVDNLNKALADAGISGVSLQDLILNVSKYGTAVRNNGGGHYNHSLFWEILTPGTAKKPQGKLAAAIDLQFGSLENLQTELNKAAAGRFGSGWAWLIVTKNNGLKVVSTANQDNPLMDIAEERGIPILGIDVWEHAYYLKYQNRRTDYLTAIWNVINWEKVSEKYLRAIEN
ncbi:MAG: superoxide dismutase [Tannerella sp.]|jgi:Fe-Mn family superoxide dismutase|nr:superoxide dismutase [Tannerella sp.]